MTSTTKPYPSKTQAEDAMRRMEYPNMRVVYSKRARGWVIAYGS